jgi:hypothetical protein
MQCLLIVLAAGQVVRAGEATLAEAPAPKSASESYGAFQKSLHDILYAEELFPGLREYLEEHAPAVAGMNAVIEPRFYYFKRDNPDGSQSEAFAGGGRVHVDSGWLYDWLSIGGSYYRSDKISGDSDEGGTGLLAPGQKSYDVLGEAYVALRHDEHKLTLYRQIIDLPYLNKNDSRMIPNTFEAYMLRGMVREQPLVGNVEYAAGYVDQIKPRIEDSFISMAEAAGVRGVDRGLYTAGIAIQPTTNFLIGAVDHYVDDVLNTLYLESNYTRELTDDLDLRFDTQFTHQQSVGDELLIGDDFSTWAFSSRLAASWKGLMCTAAAAKVHEDARIRNPYGSYPGFVSMMQSDFKLANEESWLLGVAYDFEKVGLKGFSSFVNYAQGYNARGPSGDDLADKKEFNITADYKVDEGIFRGIWLRVRWSNLDFSNDLDDSDELRIILNYEFPIL